MLVGIPKEIKIHEYRVGLTPAGARELCAHGREVVVQTGAGSGVGLTDEAYMNAGAQLVDSADEVFAKSDLIIKVKEPLPQECQLLREGQMLFTFLHLAPNPSLTSLLLNSGATCIAYETITDSHGGLPLLAPMSEVAGRMSIQKAAHCLEKSQGGSGVLMGGVPGVAPANVLILGGGVVGLNAARMARRQAYDVAGSLRRNSSMSGAVYSTNSNPSVPIGLSQVWNSIACLRCRRPVGEFAISPAATSTSRCRARPSARP